MRIVAWNCQGGLHNKFEPLLALNPDIAVVSECAKPEILARKCELPRFSAPPVWTGGNQNKGLAVFFFSDAVGTLHSPFNRDLHGIIPVEVTAPWRLNLLAVWGPMGLPKTDPGPLNRALEFYRRFLIERDAVIAGDFNHNVFWDEDGWVRNFSDTITHLDSLGLASAYHEKTREEHGQESCPTFYFYRKQNKPYHIDYIFMPRAWTEREYGVSVGSFKAWTGAGISDHTPVVLDIADT